MMLKRSAQAKACTQSGFSLLELLIAMTVTLMVMVAASTLLATSLRIRARENVRSNALSAAQRALNIMSREIGNSGYGLTDNGIVTLDSNATSIRIRSNLDNGPNLNQRDEDVRFVFQNSNTAVIRFDNFPQPNGSSAVLASNITNLGFTYLSSAGAAATPATAERIRVPSPVVSIVNE